MVDVRLLCHQSVFIDQYFSLVQWLLTLHRNLCPESKLRIFYPCYHYLTSVKEEGRRSYEDGFLPVTFRCRRPVILCLRCCVSLGNPGRMGVRLTAPSSRCLLQDVVYPRLAGFQWSHCANITTWPFLIFSLPPQPTSPHRHLSRFWWFNIFYMAVFLPFSLPLPLCLNSGVFSLRTMISLLEYILTTVECHPHLHPHTPLLPSFNCVQSNLSEIPNLTCSGSAQVQTPQMTHKSVCDLPFAYILVCGLPNFIVFI